MAAEKMRDLFEQGNVPSILHTGMHETIEISTLIQLDGEFSNTKLLQICDQYSVKFLRSEPYNPQSNRCIERFNR